MPKNAGSLSDKTEAEKTLALVITVLMKSLIASISFTVIRIRLKERESGGRKWNTRQREERTS